jgi:hypothetical protein
MVVTRDTDLVIDGYTRSASTYAVYAFQLAQDRPVRLAHHLHAPAQIVAAVRWGIPTMLVIRDPRGAVLSQAVREPGVTVRDALISWRRFYEIVLRYRSGFVVADFERIVTDFPSLVREMNERFATTFAVPPATTSYEQLVLELMGERPTTIPEWASLILSFESGLVSRTDLLASYERFRGLEDRGARPTWVPSTERNEAKSRLEAQWDAASLETERRLAQRVYDAIVGPAAS